MLREMVRVQWLRLRIPVILAAIILFTVPILVVRSGGGVGEGGMVDATWFILTSLQAGQLLPFMALGAGLVFGVAAWMDDTRGNHVYALSLPLSRERYVAYRFLAGGVPIVVTTATLFAGCLVGAAMVRLPQGVHAYPVALALRFGLATLVSYALFFTIAVATRRAVIITLGVMAAMIVVELVAGMFSIEFSIIGTVTRALTTFPGPFAIMLGRWALFDV